MLNRRPVNRREFLKAATMITAGGLLAACAPQVTTAPTQPTSAPPKAELVLLRYTTNDHQLENEVQSINISDFNAAMSSQGKPYHMELELGPATDNDYRAKMAIDAAAGTLADVVAVYNADIADYVASGYLLDLKQYLESWSDWNQYFAVLKPFAYFQGKLVGLPQGTNFTLYVRKDVLVNANIPIDNPKTWDDFYAVCDLIQKAGIIPCGIPAATPWGGGTFEEGFRMVWMSFNGTIYDSTDKKWVVSSPNLLKAFQVYENLAKKKYLDVTGLMTPNPWEPIKYQEFPQGKLAIVTGGDWQWTFDWGPQGATPIAGLFDKVIRWEFPSEDGKPFTYVEGSASPCVFSKTKSPEGCVAYIEFVANPAMGCKTMDTYIGGPSARMDFADKCPAYKTFTGGKFYESSQMFTSGRAYQFGQVGLEKIEDGIAKATEDIINLKKTSEQAMADFADSMIQQLGADQAKKA
ncbi:MAG: substrate-binding domain-containing protein [Anaerolineaceae bacterium]|jgi:ABC-type glycerol-3-phosphate transport system substrate-binding protein